MPMRATTRARTSPPIGLIASMPVVLIAHPSFPAKTDRRRRSRSPRRSPASSMSAPRRSAPAATCRPSCSRRSPGIDVAIIPYKGTAPVMNDLLGGHVPVAFGVHPAGARQHPGRQAARDRGREPEAHQRCLPDVPTFAESGMPGFESVLHYGLLAPAGTPRPIVDRLNAELRKLAANDEVKKRIARRGRRPADLEPGRICRRHRPGRGEVVGADPQAQPEGRVGSRDAPTLLVRMRAITCPRFYVRKRKFPARLPEKWAAGGRSGWGCSECDRLRSRCFFSHGSCCPGPGCPGR